MADQQDPEYFLAQTTQELERLHKQHKWLQQTLEGRIVFAPLDLKKEGLKVLDVGCADGLLLRDLQLQLPASAELIGMDVMPSFITAAQKASSDKIRYVLHDAGEPFPPEFQGTFDLTHVRYVLPGVTAGVQVTLNNLVSSLAPGGWLQVCELDLQRDSPEYCQGLKDFVAVLKELFSQPQLGDNWSSRLGEFFCDAGLEDVTVTQIRLPAGKKLGSEVAASDSIEPFKIAIPMCIMAAKQKGAVIPDSITTNLQERFEKDMMEQGGSFHTFVVTGRKPMK